MTFGQGAITVNAEGGDAREIAGNILQVLREEIRVRRLNRLIVK